MSEKLKALGYDVFDQHPAIPAGQVTVLSRDIFGKWSDDAGKTWNDSKVELPIFTAFTLQKADRLREGDTAGSDVFRVTGSHNGRFHCYLAGCRYTEDYVHPLR